MGRTVGKDVSIIQHVGGVVAMSEDEALSGDSNGQQKWEHNDVKNK